MVTLCNAQDDCEVMFLRLVLQIYGIRFYIIGEHFGSLYPGVQIPSYNERRFVVEKEDFEYAKELYFEHRTVYEPSVDNLTTKSKIRIFFEFFSGAGFFQVVKRKITNKKWFFALRNGSVKLHANTLDVIFT